MSQFKEKIKLSEHVKDFSLKGETLEIRNFYIKILQGFKAMSSSEEDLDIELPTNEKAIRVPYQPNANRSIIFIRVKIRDGFPDWSSVESL